MAVVAAAFPEQEDVFGSLAVLPPSDDDRNALLEDDACMRIACESLFNRYRTKQGGIELRAAGRIACDIHRELSLELPSDDVLQMAFLSRTLAGSSTLCYTEFSCFLEDVLSQCLRGRPFGSHIMSAQVCEDEACTVERQSQGEITIHACTLDGGIFTFRVDDKHQLQDLQQQIQDEAGIPAAMQRLVLENSVLKASAPMYAQGIVDQCMITVLRIKPQATLLRTRKAFLGNTALPVKTADGQAQSSRKKSRSSSTAGRKRSDSVARLGCRQSDICQASDEGSMSLTQFDFEGKVREQVPDVRIRKAKLGRL